MLLVNALENTAMACKDSAARSVSALIPKPIGAHWTRCTSQESGPRSPCNFSSKETAYAARNESRSWIATRSCACSYSPGGRCEKLLADTITHINVRDVEADELWSFVGMKEKAKGNLYNHVDTLGDAYTYVAIERNSKLILAWHLGKRNRQDTLAFILKLRNATDGRFQLTTDGWPSYPDAVERVFGSDIDYAQLVKVYAASRDGEQRYSPAEVVDVEVVPRIGMPDYERICTSHIERQNLTMRMQIRRLTRLTNGFSKKWVNLKAAVALHFAYYNFCRVHSSLRVTPAMEAGITDHIWTIAELIAIPHAA